VLVVAGLAATITRYVALRTWVFAHERQHRRRRMAEAARQTA
jgi:putative flippase GtrA